MSENILFKSVLSKAMALCSKRELCSSEIRSKLESWGASDDDAGKIITILKEEKFIDEQRYSASFARDKFNYNKWGKIKITSQLKAKKISSEDIRRALEEIDDDRYFSTIRNLLASHRKTIRAKNQYDLKAKLLRYGLSKGFESNILYGILGEDPENI